VAAFSLANFNPAEFVNNLTNPIGGVQSVKINSTRDLFQWRELNASTLGRIMEVYPSLGEFSVDVERIAFYNSGLLDAFKAVENGDVFMKAPPADTTTVTDSEKLNAGFNIYNQITPLHLVLELPAPNGSPVAAGSFSTERPTKVLVYDCWFDKAEVNFDITNNDLKIVQGATLTAAGLYTFR
jgi:hypothetical protein